MGRVLSEYHFFLSPTQSENYGHSIIEALLSGLPTLISDGTPWHALEENCAGFDLPLACKSDFSERLQRFVDMDAETYKKWSDGAVQYISARLAVEETIGKYVQMFTETK